MTFTSNHDINSWRWSDSALYGEKFRGFAALAATLPGMPLIYSGQESRLDKKIAFFEKDAIAWGCYENAAFYRRLMALKQRHPALANGGAGGSVNLIDTGDKDIFAFRRIKGHDKIWSSPTYPRPRHLYANSLKRSNLGALSSSNDASLMAMMTVSSGAVDKASKFRRELIGSGDEGTRKNRRPLGNFAVRWVKIQMSP